MDQPADTSAALRAAAVNATRGQWRWDHIRDDLPVLVGRDGTPGVYEWDTEVIEASHGGECGCRSACYLELNIGDPDKVWIAAANPETVLGLLDELDQLRALVAESGVGVDAAHR